MDEQDEPLDPPQSLKDALDAAYDESRDKPLVSRGSFAQYAEDE